MINEISEKYIDTQKLYDDNILTKLKLKDTIILNGEVRHICELKKEELLIFNVYNRNINKNEICIYKKIMDENKKEKIVPHFSVNEEKSILHLKELKDGNLLIVNDNQFKISEITNSQIVIKDIQKQVLPKNEYFKDIIESINGYLISISYSPNDIKKNQVNLWKKDLLSGDYIIINTIKINEKPLGLLEINKHYLGVLSELNILYIYFLQTTEIICYKKIKMPDNSPFKTMIKVIEDGILFLFEKKLILFRLSSLQIEPSLNNNFIDVCYINNSNNYFLTVFSNNDANGLFLINIDLVKCKIFKIKNANINHPLKINCILHLNNGNIITGSNDKTAKIWDIQFNAN